jgi:hypothetical protein
MSLAPRMTAMLAQHVRQPPLVEAVDDLRNRADEAHDPVRVFPLVLGAKRVEQGRDKAGCVSVRGESARGLEDSRRVEDRLGQRFAGDRCAKECDGQSAPPKSRGVTKTGDQQRHEPDEQRQAGEAE